MRAPWDLPVVPFLFCAGDGWAVQRRQRRYVRRMIVDTPLIKIRRASAKDSVALATVFRECWRQAYAGIIPALHLDRMIRDRDDAWWRRAIKRDGEILVVDAGAVVAGYATFGRSRNSRAYQGEIYELYLTPVYQGLGFGEHLFEACRQHLDARGLDGLIVWALADNQRAAEFYWQRGGRPVAQTMEPFGRTKLKKIAYGWT
jgi:ribosomal protein S18 acetylase RimI-like enzyme